VKKPTMREKFLKWFESPHGELAMDHGMKYTGWAYEAFAAGYRQAARDLRAKPRETPK